MLSANLTQSTGRTWAPPLWAVFGIGLLLWIATVAVAGVTGNLLLLPTVVMLGNFLVPVLVAILHAIFDSLSNIASYVVIAIAGLAPVMYLWRRGRRETLGTARSYFR